MSVHCMHGSTCDSSPWDFRVSIEVVRSCCAGANLCSAIQPSSSALSGRVCSLSDRTHYDKTGTPAS